MKDLLFEPGYGWLRWGLAARYIYWDGAAPDFFAIAPPARRLFETLKDFRYGYFERPTAWSYLKDPDR